MKMRKLVFVLISVILVLFGIGFSPLFKPEVQAAGISKVKPQNLTMLTALPSKPKITTKAQFTSSTNITVTGTAAAYSLVTITGGSWDVPGTASSSGSFSIIVPLQLNTVNILQVTSTDANGNVSTPATVKITQDSIAPSAPIITTYMQTVKTTTIKVTGTAEAGSTVTIKGGSATATGTASSSTGTYSITVTLNNNVKNTLSVTATDKAGNVSTASTVIITQDTIAPAAPTIDTIAQTTIYTSIVVSGTAEAYSTVTITNGTVTTTGIAINGIYSIPVNLNINSVNTLKVTATDQAGNISAATTVNITQKSMSSDIPDTTAPAKPKIITKAQITNATSITITGTAEADSTVKITGGFGGGTVIGTASDSGSYSIIVMLWSNAANTLSVTATDAAGNVSAAATVIITQDSQAPSTPTITTLAQTPHPQVLR